MLEKLNNPLVLLFLVFAVLFLSNELLAILTLGIGWFAGRVSRRMNRYGP